MRPLVISPRLLGVRRAYRRRGIATALKVRGILWAKNHGFQGVRTDTDTTNAPMIAINDRLGFVETPGRVEFRKELHPGA